MAGYETQGYMHMEFKRVLAVARVAIISATCAASMAVSPTAATTTDPQASVAADKAIADRVQAALHADPNLLSRHIKVSVEKGAVVLRGFVFSDWDMRTALRDAKKAAGDIPVVNNMSIKGSERR